MDITSIIVLLACLCCFPILALAGVGIIAFVIGRKTAPKAKAPVTPTPSQQAPVASAQPVASQNAVPMPVTCPYCRQRNRKGAKVCAMCGKGIRYCSKGHEAKAGAKFCGICREKLS